MRSLRHSLASLLRRIPWALDLAYPLYMAVQARFAVGVTAVIFNAKREVLLVEHAFHPSRPWGLPGGGLNRGEDPAGGLKRELQEELGLEIEVLSPLCAERTYRQYIDLAFYCVARGEPVHLSSELTGADWFLENELPQLTNFQRRAIEQAYVNLRVGSDRTV